LTYLAGELMTETGVQKIQGFSLQLQHRVRVKYDEMFGKKRKAAKSIYQEYGEMLIEALLRSDADGNFEIDEDELFDWIRGYPELKHIFGLSTPQGYLKRYDTYHRGTLLKKEIEQIEKDMRDKMDELEFFAEEQVRMRVLQKQMKKEEEKAEKGQ